MYYFFFERNTNFINREQIIAQIQAGLSSNKQVVLSGMPGIGKTQLAMEYLHQCSQQKNYKIIWCLRAGTVTELRASYMSLALALKVEGLSEQEIIDRTKQKLQQMEEPYLLLFDDVKAPSDLREYLPQSDKGHCIIVTAGLVNENQWHGKVLKLDFFTDDEALSLLSKLLEQEISQQEKLIALTFINKVLGHLPLGIVQAANCIKNNFLTIAKFIDQFQTYLDSFLLQEPLENYTESIFSVFSKLLKTSEIKEIFWDKEGKEFNHDFLQQSSSLRLLKLRTLLIHYGLLRKENEKFELHPLIEKIVKNKTSLEDKLKQQNIHSTSLQIIETEQLIPTMTGIMTSCAIPVLSSKILSVNGEVFYVQEYKWLVKQVNFYFKQYEHVKIILENVRAGSEKIISYKQRLVLAEPKYPIYKFLFNQNQPVSSSFYPIENIQTALEENNLVVLTGMAGIGKTYVAMNYVYSLMNSYQLIWPLFADSEKSLAMSYQSLASALNIVAEINETVTDVIRKTIKKLNDFEKPFLLLIDDVTNYDWLKDYLPDNKLGHFIITSRVDKHSVYKTLKLNLPNNTQAFEMFRNLLSKSSHGKRQLRADENKDAQYLVNDLLGCLPLGIAQAAKYISKTNITIQQYIDYFTTDLTKLWRYEENPTNYPVVLKNAWDDSFSILNDAGKTLLYYLSCLDFIDIDESILKHLVNNESEYEKVIIQLLSHHLLEKTELGFKLHPVQRLVLREKLFAEPDLMFSRLQQLFTVLPTEHTNHLSEIKSTTEELKKRCIQNQKKLIPVIEHFMAEFYQKIQGSSPTVSL